MPGPAPVSRARNGEDIVLLRALGHLDRVTYTVLTTVPDAADPRTDALEASGWEGSRVTVLDTVGNLGEAVVALGSTGAPLHLLWCAAPGRADEIFPALADSAIRPWVVLADCTGTRSRALDSAADDANYVARLFDGVSQFFIAREHAELDEALSYPRCSRDAYETVAEVQLRERTASLLEEVIHWRRLAVTAWADAIGSSTAPRADDDALAEAARLRDDLVAVTQTLSWRLTRPLRAVRRLANQLRARS